LFLVIAIHLRESPVSLGLAPSMKCSSYKNMFRLLKARSRHSGRCTLKVKYLIKLRALRANLTDFSILRIDLRT